MRIFIVIGTTIIVAVALYYLYKHTTFNNTLNVESILNKTLIHDTLYFKTIDAFGNVSAIHDSGIKPSDNLQNDKILMNVVKYEYVDGVEKVLGKPVEIAIGQNIYNLVTNNVIGTSRKREVPHDNSYHHIKLDPSKVQEKKGYYTVIIDNLWRK